ncbi:MAG TPA: heavy metal translocating P-type ATPase [Ornithinibacter sp.]|nr:heavy metal translocating P-type ATPase [Ornithinibacter sp.]
MTQTTDRMSPQQVHEVDLTITGMTCASCSARIEKKLGKLDGVDAVVNLATEKATVRFAEPVTVEQLLSTVRATGYGAEVVVPAPPAEPLSGDHVDHLDHQVAPEDALKRRALVAAVLTVPVVVLAMVPGIDLPNSAWIQLALATPVVLWCGLPFHRAAAMNARHGASTMDTLVSIGVLTAYLWSAVVVLTGRAAGMSSMDAGDVTTAHIWFETATVVTTFLLFGRWMEARATDRTRDALRGLLSLGAKDVAVERVDPTTRATTEVRIPVDDLVVGDRFVVRPGEKVATDGRVMEGSSAVDASLVTGESLPVDVTPGDELTGGSINTTGRLVVEATRVGADTTLAGIARLVERAQTTKAPVQRLADRVSAVFVPVVLVLAALTFAGWWIATGEPSRALEVAIAVLVIACPCALGLATPTALLVGTGRGARLGILIKGADVLEDTRRIDAVVLDKTGTVTTGEMTLVDVTTAGRLPKDQALRAAAAVEAGSEHPVAQAVVAAAASRAIVVPRATDFMALPGAGARARIKDTVVTVGRADLFDDVPRELARPTADGTTVWVGWDGRAHAYLTVADTVRESSARAIRDLTDAGLPAYLLTGDHDAAALAVAREVGIPAGRVLADVRPEAKHAMIADLQARGKVVAMVGDGVNDAAALAQADLGIAMGSGADVAADSADIVLLRSELPAVVDAIELSRATLRTIKQNLGWAFGYNVAAIPLAMAGLLNPMIAGGAMALSSVLVVSNSLRLRSWSRTD